MRANEKRDHLTIHRLHLEARELRGQVTQLQSENARLRSALEQLRDEFIRLAPPAGDGSDPTGEGEMFHGLWLIANAALTTPDQEQ